MATPKYPNVEVKLAGRNGNAFSVLAACEAAARRARVPDGEIKAFMDEAQADDYDHLLRTCIRWWNVR